MDFKIKSTFSNGVSGVFVRTGKNNNYKEPRVTPKESKPSRRKSKAKSKL